MSKQITIELTDEQAASLESFGNEFFYWHLSDPKEGNIPLELAVLICVMYTAVGPVRPEEWGACSLQASEIDDPELVAFAAEKLRNMESIAPPQQSTPSAR